MSDNKKPTAMAIADSIAVSGGATAVADSSAVSGGATAISDSTAISGVATDSPVVTGGKQPKPSAPASKKIAPLAWVKASKGVVPPDGVYGGRDKDGRSMYVARVTHEGDLLPGKLILGEGHNCIYIPDKAGKEQNFPEYEVLTNPGKLNLSWVHTKKGSSHPPGAVPGGKTKGGETLFIGRHTVHGFQAVGTVFPSRHCLKVSWDGSRETFEEYETLVCKD